MSTITISKKAVEQLVARIAAAKALTMAEARRVLEELVAGAMAGTVPVDAAAHPAGSESEVWTLSAAPYPCRLVLRPDGEIGKLVVSVLPPRDERWLQAPRGETNWFDAAVKQDLLRWRKRLIHLRIDSEEEEPTHAESYAVCCERAARAAVLAADEIAALPVLPVPPQADPRWVSFGKGTVRVKSPDGAVARCGDSESTKVIFLGDDGRLLYGYRAMGSHSENWAGLIARADLDREYARLRESTRRPQAVTPLATPSSAAAATHAAVFGGGGAAGVPWAGIPEYAEWFARVTEEEAATMALRKSQREERERAYEAQREDDEIRDAFRRGGGSFLGSGLEGYLVFQAAARAERSGALGSVKGLERFPLLFRRTERGWEFTPKGLLALEGWRETHAEGWA